MYKHAIDMFILFHANIKHTQKYDPHVIQKKYIIHIFSAAFSNTHLNTDDKTSQTHISYTIEHTYYTQNNIKPSF